MSVVVLPNRLAIPTARFLEDSGFRVDMKSGEVTPDPNVRMASVAWESQPLRMMERARRYAALSHCSIHSSDPDGPDGGSAA